MSNKKLTFSGVQPTGNLHLGNYLGALKNFVSLQKEMNCIYCVVDLHAITTFQNPDELKNNTLEFLENKNFHEYYNFKNGDCLGANNFSWSAALYLDLKFN